MKQRDEVRDKKGKDRGRTTRMTNTLRRDNQEQNKEGDERQLKKEETKHKEDKEEKGRLEQICPTSTVENSVGTVFAQIHVVRTLPSCQLAEELLWQCWQQ